MKKIILILSLFFGAIGAWAQIPAEVTDVMNHCRAAMNNASGLEYEADMKAGIGPLAMKMHFVIANKGDLKALGQYGKVQEVKYKDMIKY